MSAIHLIERLKNYWQVDGSETEWESGYWVIKKDKAAKLIGGDLYLHKKQKEPSFFGGKIVGCRLEIKQDREKVIFRFVQSADHEGVDARPGGWGNEQKRVWS